MSDATEPSALRPLLLAVRNQLAFQASLGLDGLELTRPVLVSSPLRQIPGATANAVTSPPPEPASGVPTGSLTEVREHLGPCTRCRLSQSRTHLVFGAGPDRARLMIVGEAPGRDEDVLGEPFVGAAGKLLDRMLAAMGLSRREVYIANMLKCRPPKNRYPEADEISACRPFVRAQIEAVAPELVLILGRCAAQALLETRAPLGKLRGRMTRVGPFAALPTFHPAYLLRNPADKALAWRDLQDAMRHLGLRSKA